MPEVIIPDWPVRERVKALITTRVGGVSRPPFASFNLAGHVGDLSEAVATNRSLLRAKFALPSEPNWLNQVHGCAVADCVDQPDGTAETPIADAAISTRLGQVCAVMTADCLPVLLCNRAGTKVAVAHAGWRGLAEGVLEATVERLDEPGPELMAWLGPAIGPGAFEVGPEVRECFQTQDPAAAKAFRTGSGDRWYADIYQLARIRLTALGLGFIGGGNYCTVTDSQRFFSYRRDGVTGRMASLIWIEPASESF